LTMSLMMTARAMKMIRGQTRRKEAAVIEQGAATLKDLDARDGMTNPNQRNVGRTNP
jgi:prephenate dehydratase